MPSPGGQVDRAADHVPVDHGEQVILLALREELTGWTDLPGGGVAEPDEQFFLGDLSGPDIHDRLGVDEESTIADGRRYSVFPYGPLGGFPLSFFALGDVRSYRHQLGDHPGRILQREPLGEDRDDVRSISDGLLFDHILPGNESGDGPSGVVQNARWQDLGLGSADHIPG